MVLICLPGYAIAKTLEAIKPFLDSDTIVGTVVSSTGFFFEAFDFSLRHLRDCLNNLSLGFSEFRSFQEFWIMGNVRN